MGHTTTFLSDDPHYPCNILAERHVPTCYLYQSTRIASLFQSLGLRAPKYRSFITMAGHGLATVLVLGNISMPVAVMLGIISKGG